MPYPDPVGSRGAGLAALIAAPVKTVIAQRVVSLFNDRARGERPVRRRPDGWFGPRSMAWQVHGDVTAMMVGGIAGLLLQMLHPAVLAGVWDHSNFRQDMPGRLRRTARFIAQTTYGSPEEAQAAVDRVRAIHDRIGGVLPDGTAYAASDPTLLAWVHVTETTCFLNSWLRYAAPGTSAADQDRYIAEMARIGVALGADPVPRSRAEAQALVQAMRPRLRCDDRTREVARFLLTQRARSRAVQPFQTMAMHAAVDLLPDWARVMHGLPSPVVSAPLVRAGTLGLAVAVRWAFR
ncbi:oxygenase MpaB family protein [Rhodopila sp.]|jgi:uncharacterized protein (DUF2236 family)|uniref:oxygenase MpaB family protein n=1 Tax=Rhodopila sp. TaxID=2480087 RepID=UPI002C3F9FC9|nr:oxygenase MpaB family protein [Rhodopila sp.]HVZ06802.1 oxygenase MpaB family protein [Rhodopila sp.]